MKNALIFVAGGVVGFGLAGVAYNSLFKNAEEVYEDRNIIIMRGKTITGKWSSAAQIIDKRKELCE